MDKPAAPPIVAYLTGEYPRVSHTFIQREVAALRELGVDVRTCSIRTTGAADRTGEEEREAARSTFYVLRAARNPLTLIRAHLLALLRGPRRYLAAFALAVRLAPPGAAALAWQMFYFAEAGVLADWMRRNGIGHLHNHFADSSCTVALLASHLSGVPFSFTMHGPTEFFAVERWRLDEKIARAAFVACISHFCRSQMMLFSSPDQWDKLHIVHCGIIPERYGRDASRTSGKRLVFVGRLAAAKGVPVLVDAFREVLRRHPDATLTLVGDGPERPLIEARATEAGISDALEITGYLSQSAVADRLGEGDVFVLPSFAEGLPVVLMEAMASGLPVVATRIAGVSELVEDGVSGLLVPPGDATALAGAICRLFGDAALRERLAAAGRQTVAAEFDGRIEAKKLRQLIFAHLNAETGHERYPSLDPSRAKSG